MSSSGLAITLRRDNLYEQVADQLEMLITDRQFLPEHRLPSERQLAEQLKVSRPIIREALRMLRARGLIRVRPGDGTFVQSPAPRDLAMPIKRLIKLQSDIEAYEQLCHVRRALEVEIAGIAAERVTPEDVMTMESTLKAMAAHQDDAEAFARTDLAFHGALVTATKNSIFNALLTPITDLLLEFRLAAFRFDPRGSVRGGLKHHRLILDCVQRKDSQGAREAMREHLRQAEDLIQRAYKKPRKRGRRR